MTMSLVPVELGFSLSKTLLSKAINSRRNKIKSCPGFTTLGNNWEKETLLRLFHQLFLFLWGICALNIPVHFGDCRPL